MGGSPRGTAPIAAMEHQARLTELFRVVKVGHMSEECALNVASISLDVIGRLKAVLPHRCTRPRCCHPSRSFAQGSTHGYHRQRSMAGSQGQRIRLPG